MKRPTVNAVRRGAGIVAGVALMLAAGVWLSPWGMGFNSGLAYSSPLPLLAPLARGVARAIPLLMLLTIYAPFLALQRLVVSLRSKPMRQRSAAWSAVFVAGFVTGCTIFPWAESYAKAERQAGLERITARARPLIGAIEAYRRANNGRPPASLDDLVPRYLPAIPDTGAAGYPTFTYRLPDRFTHFHTYELRVETPRTAFNWDCFLYWPEQHYPDRLYGSGTRERINGWVYINE